jgi:hypothetical protein
LKSGILKGIVIPLSVETVDRRAVKASSLSLEGDIEVGNDTNIYLVDADMADCANAKGWLLLEAGLSLKPSMELLEAP